MFKTVNTILVIFIFTLFFNGCATWYGIKQDSKEAWEVTKSTTGKVYDSTKKAIHEATED